MNRAGIPTRISMPFADGGAKNIIPVASQALITPGAASFVDGFPPATRTPIESGGVPPDGLDFNGIFNGITAWLRWQASGGPVWFDQTFANAIGGYPLGAILQNLNDVNSLWINEVDNNTHNPDNGDTTGWNLVPLNNFASVRQGTPSIIILGWDGTYIDANINGTGIGKLAILSDVTNRIQAETDARTQQGVNLNNAISATATSLQNNINGRIPSGGGVIYNQTSNYSPSGGVFRYVNSYAFNGNTTYGATLRVWGSINVAGAQPVPCGHRLIYNSAVASGQVIAGDNTTQSMSNQISLYIPPNTGTITVTQDYSCARSDIVGFNQFTMNLNFSYELA